MCLCFSDEDGNMKVVKKKGGQVVGKQISDDAFDHGDFDLSFGCCKKNGLSKIKIFACKVLYCFCFDKKTELIINTKSRMKRKNK